MPPPPLSLFFLSLALTLLQEWSKRDKEEGEKGEKEEYGEQLICKKRERGERREKERLRERERGGGEREREEKERERERETPKLNAFKREDSQSSVSERGICANVCI